MRSWYHVLFSSVCSVVASPLTSVFIAFAFSSSRGRGSSPFHLVYIDGAADSTYFCPSHSWSLEAVPIYIHTLWSSSRFV